MNSKEVDLNSKEEVKKKEESISFSKKNEVSEANDEKDFLIKELEEKVKFLEAEKQNNKRDFQIQLMETSRIGKRKVIMWVLDFLKNLDRRTIKFMKEEGDNKVAKHLKGIEIMRNNLWKHLEAEGVEEIKIEIGKDRWNSNFHEFVEEVLDENLQEGTVVKVEENGYLLFGKVLFPAKVIISKKNKK